MSLQLTLASILSFLLGIILGMLCYILLRILIGFLSSIEKREAKRRLRTPEGHRARHMLLHKCLDELIADYIDCTGELPSKTTLGDLMVWSYKQTK